MATVLRNKSFQRNLFFSIVSIFILFAVCFGIYQHQREKIYKIDILHARLQMFNYETMQTLGEEGLLCDSIFLSYTKSHSIDGMRITVIDNNGEVVLDSTVPYWAGHNVYKRNEDGSLALDGFGDPIVVEKKKHYVPSSPQIAASLGLDYSNNYLFAGIDFQYFDKMYLDMNPLYRTDMAVNGPDGVHTPQEEEYMAAQEQFPRAFVLNANIGKSWYIRRQYNIGFSLSVNNILNNTNVRTGGYEQTRLIDSEDFKRYYRFDSKYFYMMGTNYMLNVWFRF